MSKIKQQKGIAAFFLCLMFFQLAAPLASYAVTDGPSQPEMSKFQPAGASDMVDLFTGDFKYNIPLFEIGGYPINLAYHTGDNIEDEASWVGAGWTLNPGAINRTVRGLPDDFDGSKGDAIIKRFNKKEYKKYGASLTLKPSALAFEIGKANVKVNVYKDNYYGMGASFGAGVDFSSSIATKTPMTAGLGLDINSDVRDGLNISPSFSLENQESVKGDELGAKVGLSGGLLYNTRGGLKSIELGTSFSPNRLKGQQERNFTTSAVSYFGQSYTPFIQTNSANVGYTFSIDGGFSIFGGYLGIGGTGYYNAEKNLDSKVKVPAYGYFNHYKGRKNLNALLDFNREKDGPYIPSAPSIAIPVSTPDLYAVNNQFGSMQFKPFLNQVFTVFDNQHFSKSSNTSAGLTVGGGNVYKSGARISHTQGSSLATKWVDDNLYLSSAELNPLPYPEAITFKESGELSSRQVNSIFYTSIGNKDAVRNRLSGKSLTKNLSNGTIQSSFTVKQFREPRANVFSYMDAQVASGQALDKQLHYTDDQGFVQSKGRINSIQGRKKHSMSEITITESNGRRMVYGIPVMNLKKVESSFSVVHPQDPEIARSGLIPYTSTDASINNRNGRDWYYNKEETPAYATSFLLSAVLSPDYFDKTGNGISDDDLGTAVKFNYQKRNRNYKWRAPFGLNKANYNEGFLTDPKDDKASYVYGERELWYVSSIESNNLIAIFWTSDRNDGRGVSGETGDIDTDLSLRKLDSIQIFSKADYLKNGVYDANPIKVVHFKYSNNLVQGIPNYFDGAAPENQQSVGGKLTLEKLWFTFGRSGKGKSNPYEFFYDQQPVNNGDFPQNNISLEAQDKYTTRQLDRWGNYKQSFYNRIVGGNGLMTNSEFPYVIQQNDQAGYNVRQLADRMASKWQLNKIITPSNGLIEVTYEADDYCFVQDRRAMQMCFIKGVNTAGNSTGLINATQLVIDLPMDLDVQGLNSNEAFEKFTQAYLKQANGELMKYLFYKAMVKLTPEAGEEYVYGYAELDLLSTENKVAQDGKSVTLVLKKQNKYSPITKSAWQLIRTSLPQFAYDSYDNTDFDGGDFKAGIQALISSIKNFRELVISQDKIFEREKKADQLNLNKSMVRLFNPGLVKTEYAKIGGGSRVKKLTISDEWDSFTQGYKSKQGQLYEYTTTYNGQTISSGVASYEPQIGNEENPFHEPVPYVEKVHWSSDKYHYIEMPYCETFFPAASVGYSAVKITPVGDDYLIDNAPLVAHTGYTEHSFYTAKDFPVKVEQTTLEKAKFKSSFLLQLFTSTYINKLALSQGFKVELNDMHGKPKSVKVFSSKGVMISSAEYFYKVKDNNAAFQELDNVVNVLGDNGVVQSDEIGVDIDYTSDLRDYSNSNIGGSVGLYSGGLLTGFIFFPYLPYLGVNVNSSISDEQVRTASSVKVIQRYGILEKTISTTDGSRIEAQNMLWDKSTGDVILSRTQNEFDDYLYTFNYPAYLGYAGMGAAYINQGKTISINNSLAGGISGTDANILTAGDELVDLAGAYRYWVIIDKNRIKRLINKAGDVVGVGGSFLVVRSGFRNQLTASAGTVVTMKNPVVAGRLDLSQFAKVLQSSALTYKEEWGMPMEYVKKDSILSSCRVDSACLKDYLYRIISYKADGKKRGITSGIEDGMNMNDAAGILDFKSIYPSCFTNFYGDGVSVFSMPYYLEQTHYNSSTGEYTLQIGDRVQMGPAEMVFDYVDPEFNAKLNSGMSYNDMWSLLNSQNSSSQNIFYWKKTGDCSYSLKRIPEVQSAFLPQGTCEDDPYCTTWFTIHLEGYPLTNSTCVDPLNQKINPYVAGILGNWRPWTNYVYTVDRVQPTIGDMREGTTNIQKSGYYSGYTPFWMLTATGMTPALSNIDDFRSTNDPRWVWNQSAVLYDGRGNAIEGLSPLMESGLPGMYSSAGYGYNATLQTAFLANGRSQEMAFDGFEDYNFTGNQPVDPIFCPVKRPLDFGLVKTDGIWSSVSGTLTDEQAHTGRYSYKLTGNFNYSGTAGTSDLPGHIVGFQNGQTFYSLLNNGQSNGIKLIAGKKYVLSCWVNESDDNSGNNHINKLQVIINGTDQQVQQKVVPVVEGWKKVEITFVAQSSFSLQLNPTGSLYLDDIRIQPFNSQMKSFVYDEVSLRLRAQLDENNFATYYEYDEEGTPVRVKKETERGIMTLKETRQHFKLRPNE